MSMLANDQATSAGAAVPRKLAVINGMVDNATPTSLFGWVHDAADPGTHLTVELYLGTELLDAVLANTPRPDLANAGIGDGCCAFELKLAPGMINRLAEFSIFAIDGSGIQHLLPFHGPRFAQLNQQPRPTPSVSREASQVTAAPQQAQQAKAEQQAQSNEVLRLREELVGFVRQVGQMPDRAMLNQVIQQNELATEQVKAAVATLEARLQRLPDADLIREVVQQQGLLTERLTALETWLTRLESRLTEVPIAKAETKLGRADPWQMVLFGSFGISLVVALVVGLAIRLM